MTEAARAILEIRTVEWNGSGGETRDKKILWENSAPALLSYHLEDLSMSSYKRHQGDPAKITQELVPVGRAMIVVRPWGATFDDWGRQVKTAVGAL